MNDEPARGECPDCGQTVPLRKDGAPRKHDCTEVDRPVVAESEPTMTTSAAPRTCAVDGCRGLPSVGTRCPKHWNGRSYQ